MSKQDDVIKLLLAVLSKEEEEGKNPEEQNKGDKDGQQNQSPEPKRNPGDINGDNPSGNSQPNEEPKGGTDQPVSDPEGDKKPNNQAGSDDDTLAKIKEIQRNAYIDKADLAIERGFNKSGIDEASINEIKKFIDYDKLSSDENALDESKVEGLVSAFSSIAMNTPPSGKAYDPTNEKNGLSQYL